VTTKSSEQKEVNNFRSIADWRFLSSHISPAMNALPCIRCESVDGLIPHPSVVHPRLMYCNGCYNEMAFHDETRWKGERSGRAKTVIAYCAMCWRGAGHREQKRHQVICSTKGCPMLECMSCIRHTRPEVHTQLQVNLKATTFACIKCEPIKHRTPQEEAINALLLFQVIQVGSDMVTSSESP
jgi:hypothetical protein